MNLYLDNSNANACPNICCQVKTNRENGVDAKQVVRGTTPESSTCI